MKRYTCILTSVLQLILCALLSSAAALPTLISLVNPPIVQAANATPTSTGLVPLGTRLPFHYQGVVLVFTNFGNAIPWTEVVDVLGGADRIVAGYLDTKPQQGIPENRFEYRLPQGNVLLAIGGLVGKDITWRQLYRVLQALTRFMIVLPPPVGPHCQELNFDIQISDEGGVLGNGVIWYFPSAPGEVQKRTITTPVLAVSDGSLLAFNESSNLTLALGSNEDVVSYPIPGTSMTLEFYYLGLGLLRAIVRANLKGAIKEVGKYSPGPYENTTIRNNRFQLVTTGSTSRIATTVWPSNNHQITWLELSYVLDGLYQFVHGFNELITHFQTLGCRVLDNYQGKIGVATLAYYDPGPPGVERRGVADGESSLGSALPQIAKLTNQSFLSVLKDSIPEPMPWSIPGTDLTLTFTVVGDDIPLIELLTLIGVGQSRIASRVQSTPDEPIGSFRYQNGPGTLVIKFVTYDGNIITWLELHQILIGLAQFCAVEGNSRASKFLIDAAGRGRIGFGVVTLDPIQTLIPRRASGRGYPSKSDSTLLSPGNPTAIQRRVPSFSIPGTNITLDIDHIGAAAISPIDISSTLTSALQIIEPHLKTQGAEAIPTTQWAYRNRITNVNFGVTLRPGRTLSWQQLNWLTIGLLHWMTGPGLSYCKSLTFFVEILNQEGVAIIVGFGSVYQSQIPMGEIKGPDPASLFDIGLLGVGASGKRNSVSGNSLERRAAESPNPAEEGILPQSHLTSPWFSQVATQSISARPANAMLQIITPFCIPGSPLTITITRLLRSAVPAVPLVELFNGARQFVQAEVAQRPQDHLANGCFYYEVPDLEGFLAAITVESVPGHTISWLELDETLRGLEYVVTRKTTQTLYMQNLLFKRNIDMAEWSKVQGLLCHTTHLPQNLAVRSVLSSTGTNLTVPIPYPIPDTAITLKITLLSPPIPVNRLTDLFNNARWVLYPNIRDHPDENYDKQRFFFQIVYHEGRELIAIEVYPQVNEHLTWLQLYQAVNGLQLFMNGAEGQSFRQPVVFKVEINGVYVAYGLLIYVPPPPTSTLKARSLPPPNADPIPYPIIGTPVTIVITSLLPTPIPFVQVIEFFDLAFYAIREEVVDRPDSPISFGWDYRQAIAPRAEMSLTIRRTPGHSFTWRTLAAVLDGLDDFMEGRWRPTQSLQALAFDIEIVDKGVVANGTLSYTTGLSGLGEVAGNSLISNSTSLS